MASRFPGTRYTSYYTPGPLGRNDFADPDDQHGFAQSESLGSTPGLTGRNDYADAVARSAERTAPGTADKRGSQRYVVYQDSVKVGGDRNWRNNNPGNIVRGTFAARHGGIGDDRTFAIFPDWETGVAALRALLQSGSYQSRSVGDAIARFAPPTENDTDAYQRFIERQTGVSAATSMSTLTPAQLNSIASAILRFEGGNAGTIYRRSDPNLPVWIRALLGMPPAPPASTPAARHTPSRKPPNANALRRVNRGTPRQTLSPGESSVAGPGDTLGVA